MGIFNFNRDGEIFTTSKELARVCKYDHCRVMRETNFCCSCYFDMTFCKKMVDEDGEEYYMFGKWVALMVLSLPVFHDERVLAECLKELMQLEKELS